MSEPTNEELALWIEGHGHAGGTLNYQRIAARLRTTALTPERVREVLRGLLRPPLVEDEADWDEAIHAVARALGVELDEAGGRGVDDA